MSIRKIVLAAAVTCGLASSANAQGSAGLLTGLAGAGGAATAVTIAVGVVVTAAVVSVATDGDSTPSTN